jgi:hypothetical protein
VKYMILIQSNPQFLERREALPKEQRERFGRDHLALSAELAGTGELVAVEGLADPALAKRVTIAGDQTTISGGPFAEAKEHLAGFLLIDCENEARALADRGTRARRRLGSRGGPTCARFKRIRRVNAAAEPDVAELLRELAPRVLVRRNANFDDCEDAVQEALLATTVSWSVDGVRKTPPAG